MSDGAVRALQAEAAAAAATAVDLPPSESGTSLQPESGKLLQDADIKVDVQAERKEWGDDEKFTFDAVMVFKKGDPEKKYKFQDTGAGGEKVIVEVSGTDLFNSLTAEVLTKLKHAGIKTDLWYSVQGDEIYCRMGVTESRLQAQADAIDYDLQLNHERCLHYARDIGLRLAQITDQGQGISSDAWLHMFGKYKLLDPQDPGRHELYNRYYSNEEDRKSPHYNSLFNGTDRIKLLVTIIEGDEKIGGAGLSFSKCIANSDHPMIAFFPLHENDKKEKLMKQWFSLTSTFKSPLQEIRDYFGEAIAFYFAFLAYYNRSLLIPALIGLAFFIYQLVETRVDVEAVPAYAIFVALWASLFLEIWKRKEANYRIRWGMTKFLQKEQSRPEFSGDWQPSPVDGRRVEVFPWYKKVKRILLSQTVIWTLIGIVIACVVGVFFFRKLLKESTNTSTANYITAIINAVQIQILNIIYGLVSRSLNEYENHRTDTEYENALIAKSFLFKFVNSYNTLFYIAWFKKNDDSVGGCLNNNCLGELRIQLGTIFVAAIIINNFIELVVPKAISMYQEYTNRQTVGIAANGIQQFADKSIPEKEYELAPYESTFDDFDELVVQYGFVTLFVVAFPIAPLLALINNVIETRVDSYKVCRLTRRPEPRGAANIGTWYDILNIVSLIAVVTNVALVCFATDKMKEWAPSAEDRAYTFILAEHAIFLGKFAIAYFIPDEPLDYAVHVARQDYIVSVLITGMKEEPDLAVPNEDGVVEKPKVFDYDWESIPRKIQLGTGHEW